MHLTLAAQVAKVDTAKGPGGVDGAKAVEVVASLHMDSIVSVRTSIGRTHAAVLFWIRILAICLRRPHSPWVAC